MATQACKVNFEYVLGYTPAEHERLIRQAALIAPYTERLFRRAGIGRGQRLLDLGSGVGDVSMLLGRIVGPSVLLRLPPASHARSARITCPDPADPGAFQAYAHGYGYIKGLIQAVNSEI